jgi:GT2 family glycosyltransferase
MDAPDAIDGAGSDRCVPAVSVCIVSFNTKELLRVCLQSVGPASRRPVQIVVVDNASTDGSADMVHEEFPQVLLVRHAVNRGFAAAANVAFRAASGEFLLLLNPDALLPAGAVHSMLEFLVRRPDAGLCGPRLVYPDGRFQCCGYRFPAFWSEFFEMAGGPFHRRPFRRPPPAPGAPPFEVDWLCGACILVRREALESVGPFDERFFLYGEELDWCVRARSEGWRIWALPAVEVVHHLGQSSQSVTALARACLVSTRLQYYRKHRARAHAAAVAALYLARAAKDYACGHREAGGQVRAVLEGISGGKAAVRPRRGARADG